MMPRRASVRPRVALASSLVFAFFGLAILFGGALSTNTDQANIDQGQCLECHEYHEEGLMGTAHELNATGAGIHTTCTSCHQGLSDHVGDPDEHGAPRFEDMQPIEAFKLCSTCHATVHEQATLEHSAHAQNDINCSACHQIHDGEHADLLRQDQTSLCQSCHKGVQGDFAKPFRHPVNDGVMTCSDCHKTIDSSHRRGTYTSSNDACNVCHQQFRGPFMFEHSATLDFATDDGGCMNCHDPHGSHTARMLNQTYEAPNFALCSQCHAVPKHQMNSFHGTQWAGQPCNDCHVDIHGSYRNRNLLSPVLEAQGCFVAGCHKL